MRNCTSKLVIPAALCIFGYGVSSDASISKADRTARTVERSPTEEAAAAEKSIRYSAITNNCLKAFTQVVIREMTPISESFRCLGLLYKSDGMKLVTTPYALHRLDGSFGVSIEPLHGKPEHKMFIGKICDTSDATNLSIVVANVSDIAEPVQPFKEELFLHGGCSYGEVELYPGEKIRELVSALTGEKVQVIGLCELDDGPKYLIVDRNSSSYECGTAFLDSNKGLWLIYNTPDNERMRNDFLRACSDHGYHLKGVSIMTGPLSSESSGK